MVGALKVLTAPGVWAIASGVATGPALYCSVNKAATSYPIGATPVTGFAFLTNQGGFTLDANDDVVVPEAGTYAITVSVGGASMGAGSAAGVIINNAATNYIPLQPNTSVGSGATTTRYLAAGNTVGMTLNMVGNAATVGATLFVTKVDGTGPVGPQGPAGNVNTDQLPTVHTAAGIAGTTSGTTALQVATCPIPAHARPGMLTVQAFLRTSKTVGSDVFLIKVTDELAFSIVEAQTYQGTAFEWTALSGYLALTGAAKELRVSVSRVSGTGTASMLAGPNANSIMATYTPT